MASKNLSFKLVMDADVKNYVSNVKQSEATTRAVFATIKTEADKFRGATDSAAQGLNALSNEARSTTQHVSVLDQAIGQTNAELAQTRTAAAQVQASIGGLRTGFTALASALAAVGVGVTAQALIQTVDTYTSLSTQVRLATEDSGNFEQAMAGVHQVALATNSSLDGTAMLFARVNDAGKEMGYTQQQTLQLTKTITQAIQAGGGSAQAAEDALQQFIQALQGGVLRGEEFNSVMEGAPGLAKALAQSFNVTTGELRKMAENGELTSDRVLKAVESMSGKVQATYDKMPMTIGNALQRIQTQWQILIGTMDQSNSASSTVALWMATLADNMDVVETLLADIGQGFVWVGDQLKKIDPATIEALKTALSSIYETVKSVGSTMATGFEALVDVLNTALSQVFNFSSGVDTANDKTNGFTKVLQVLNVAVGFINDGFNAIGIGINLFVGALYSAGSAWEGLKARFTWGDIKEQALANMSAMQAKAEEYYQKASDGAINFQSKGVQALQEIGKTQQQKDAESVASAKAAMDQMLAKQQSAVESTKAAEAEKLNAVKAYAEVSIAANKGAMDGAMQADLLTKGYIVTLDQAGKVSVEAWKKSEDGANRAAISAQTAAMRAAKALGVDVPVALNQLSDGFKTASGQLDKVASGFDALKNDGIDASALLAASLEQLTDKAKSQAEIDYVRKLYVQFGKDGKLANDQVAAGLDNINQKLDKTPDALSDVQEAFKALGLTMKKEASEAAQVQINAFNTIKNSGQASAEQIRKALIGMADKIYASGDAAKISWYEAQLAANDLKSEISNTGDVAVSSMEPIERAMHRVRNSTRDAEQGFRDLGRAAREEAKDSITVWNDMMEAHGEAERKNRGNSRTGVAVRSITKAQIEQELRNMGYSEQDAKQKATTIFNEGINADRSVMQGNSMYGSAGKWTNKMFQDLHDAGKTATQGTIAIEKLLAQAASNVSPNVNDRAPSIAQPMNSNLNTEPAKTVRYQFTNADGQQVDMYGSEQSGNALEEMLSELEMLKKAR